MPLNIIRNDITRVSADAIVNTANPQVAFGAGVDQAIYEAAGADRLLAERAKIGPMRPGQAAATPAFALDAKYIIHTVGPAWQGGDCGEREAVASCYRESLKLADELHCESVAFPLISTGTYGFPKDEALKIAIGEISSFLFSHDMTVYMVVYSREAFVISSKAFSDIQCYIEDKDVLEHSYSAPRSAASESRRRRFANESAASESMRRRFANALLRRGAAKKLQREEDAFDIYEADVYEADVFEADVSAAEEIEYCQSESGYVPEASFFAGSSFDGDLGDVLNRKTETFQQMLFRIIDRKGMTDPEVYKKANLDRKLFSKIRSSEDYLPKKKTVLALAIALELNMDETIDLLQRAGIALNPSSRFDLIVGYCIDHEIYNVFDINTYLFEYDQPLLGA